MDIAVLCVVVLALMGVLSDREQRKSEKKYDDTEAIMNESMKTVKIIWHVPVWMLILKIPIKGDYIFVSEKEVEKAK